MRAKVCKKLRRMARDEGVTSDQYQDNRGVLRWEGTRRRYQDAKKEWRKP